MVRELVDIIIKNWTTIPLVISAGITASGVGYTGYQAVKGLITEVYLKNPIDDTLSQKVIIGTLAVACGSIATTFLAYFSKH